MSSLRNLLRKGRIWHEITDPEYVGLMKEVVRPAAQAIRSPDVILVNAQSVMDDVLPLNMVFTELEAEFNRMLDRVMLYENIPRPNPPFRRMWIEADLMRKTRLGVLCWRTEVSGRLESILKSEPLQSDGAGLGFAGEEAKSADMIRRDNPSFISFGMLFREVQGAACFSGTFTWWIDAEGNMQNTFRQCPREDENGEIDSRTAMKVMLAQGWVLHTFARMNCHNAALRPICEGKLRPHPPNKVVPASVWHEIVITSVPKVRSTGKDAFPHEESEVRAHWIRGHYADYRNGAGLFGNPKLRGIFWIPEHRKGNEELGQVIPEYAIQ